MSPATLPELFRLASTQGGYFTAKQAQRLGYSRQLLRYHRLARNIRSVGRGVYRQPLLPVSEHDDLIRISLWSRDLADRPQAVASHATALALHGLSDVLPQKLHFTVPRTFRKATPRGCELHRARLAKHEIAEGDGFALTTPLRTLHDVSRSGSITREQFERACDDALRRGLVKRSELALLRQSPRASSRSRAASRGAK
jgi:predicted transcriptional regulator of viral defense system